MRHGGSQASGGSEFFGGTQRLLDLAMLSDVTHNLGCSNHMAGCILDRGDREGNVDPFAILPYAHGLEVIDSFSPPNFAENHGFIRLQLWRDDQRDRTSDHLLG